MRVTKYLSILITAGWVSTIHAGSISGSESGAPTEEFVSCDARPNFNRPLFKCTEEVKKRILDRCYVVLHKQRLGHCTWQSCDHLSVVAQPPKVTRIVKENYRTIRRSAPRNSSQFGSRGGSIVFEKVMTSKDVEIDEYGVKSILTGVSPSACGVGEVCLKNGTHDRQYMKLGDALQRSRLGLKGDSWDPLAKLPAAIMNSNPYVACARDGGSYTAKLILDGERNARNAFVRNLSSKTDANGRRKACVDMFNENSAYLADGIYRCYVNGFEVWNRRAERHADSWNLDVNKDGKVDVDGDARLINEYLTPSSQNYSQRRVYRSMRMTKGNNREELTEEEQLAVIAEELQANKYIQAARDNNLLDVDRDGQVLASSDGVLIERVLRGLTFAGDKLLRNPREWSRNQVSFTRGFVISPTSKLIPLGKTLETMNTKELAQLADKVREIVVGLYPAQGQFASASNESQSGEWNGTQNKIKVELFKVQGSSKEVLFSEFVESISDWIDQTQSDLLSVCNGLIKKIGAHHSHETFECTADQQHVRTYFLPADDPTLDVHDD